MSEHTGTELEVEFNHIKAWAAANCLHLNLSKTKEIVFRQPRITYFHLPPAVDDIEQVNCCKLLGVISQSNFKMDSHMYTTSSPSVFTLNFCGIRVCRVNSYQLSHTLLLYLVFYMLYQRGADFCLPSLRIRSMPFLGASSDLVTRLATLQCQI